MEIRKEFLPDVKINDPDRACYTNRPQCVVMHWTGAPGQSADGVRRFFQTSPTDAHYIIGLKGEIIQCLPENVVAFHAHHGDNKDPASGKYFTDEARHRFGTKPDGSAYSPNTKSIGIEMCCADDTGSFTDETIGSAIELVVDILKRYNLTADAITTHHNLVGWKDCPKLWTDHPALLDAFRDSVRKSMGEI